MRKYTFPERVMAIRGKTRISDAFFYAYTKIPTVDWYYCIAAHTTHSQPLSSSLLRSLLYARALSICVCSMHFMCVGKDFTQTVVLSKQESKAILLMNYLPLRPFFSFSQSATMLLFFLFFLLQYP